jgi:hypothetical protein
MLNKAESMRRYLKWVENEKNGGSKSEDEKAVNVDVNEKAKTDVGEDFIKPSLNIQSFERNDSVSIKINRVRRKGEVGTKGYCIFCGSEGVIVEKFSPRGYEIYIG